jgi:hypothetical protein
MNDNYESIYIVWTADWLNGQTSGALSGGELLADGEILNHDEFASIPEAVATMEALQNTVFSTTGALKVELSVVAMTSDGYPRTVATRVWDNADSLNEEPAHE